MTALARLVGTCLLCAVASSQQPPQPAPASTARLAGRSAEEWAERVRGDMKAAIAELAAPGAAGLPVLDKLLADPSDTVAETAARACAAIGPAAAPLLPALARELRERSAWIPAWHCADAARAIGVAEPTIVAALLAQMQQSTVPALRQQCALVYDRLQPEATQRILAAAARGEFSQTQFAVDALACLGERAAPTLADHLRTHPEDNVARGAVEAIGWRTVPWLERAGLTAIAESVLRSGPLRHVPMHEQFTLEFTGAPVVLPRLPAIAWESTYGHGTDFDLYRAVEDERGLRVDQISLVAEPAPHVRVRTTMLTRDRAMALARQLAVLGRMRLAPRARQQNGLFSSGDFFARVRVSVGADTLLDATFGGYPASDNTPDRLQPQAAIAILFEALADATWTERAATADERAAVDARSREIVAQQPEWAAARLQQLRSLLAPLAPR